MILGDVLRLLGRDEDLATVIVGQGDYRLHINANARIDEAVWESDICRFRVVYPAGEQGVVVVFNVTRPAKVSLNGTPIAERDDIEKGAQPGWLSARNCLPVDPRSPRWGIDDPHRRRRFSSGTASPAACRGHQLRVQRDPGRLDSRAMISARSDPSTARSWAGSPDLTPT